MARETFTRVLNSMSLKQFACLNSNKIFREIVKAGISVHPTNETFKFYINTTCLFK